MVGAHVGRVPLRELARGEDDRVLDEPQRRLGREHVGAARQVLLDDVVLDGAGELVARRALLVGDGDVEREQPGRRRVDRHRGVHLVERDAGQQRAHVADVGDGHADLADLALGELVVAVIARLRRQIEGDRRGPSGPSPGSCGRARWTWSRSSVRHRCGRSRAGRAPVLGGLLVSLLSSRMRRPRLGWAVPP